MSNLLLWRGRRTLGPCAPDDVRAWLARGELAPDALAWTEGFTDWAPLSEVLERLQARPAGPTPEFTDLGRQALLPEGVRGFSWAGLFMGPIWSIGNRVWIGLLTLVPGLGQLVMFWLGFHGRELAWRAGHWKSVEQFQRVQRRWSYAGFVALAIGIVLSAAVVMEQGALRRAQPAADTAEPVARPPGPADGPPPDAGPARALNLPATRNDFERALHGRTPNEVQALAGRPQFVREQQGVLVYVYRGVTQHPRERRTDDIALILFTEGRASSFKYGQEQAR